MEELDEFGIPIKKQTSKVTLDEFGIPIKKKDALQPTSTPQKSVSGTPTGSSVGVNPAFKSSIPSPIPDFNNLPKSKERSKVQEETSFLDDVVSTVKSKVNKLATGSAQLGADYASTPELLYDAFAMPQNAIADYFDMPSLRADSEKFKKNIGVRNAVKEHYQGEVIKLREHAKQVDTQYQDGIYDSFKNGDVLGGFDQLTNSFAESLAATSSIMMGGAFAKAPQLLATSSMVFGAGKNEQLKDENPDMNTNARVVNALATGLAEGVFETIGSGSIGAAARGIIEREGAKKGAIILKDGLTNIYKATIAKNPLLASMGVEGGTEWATKVTQNSIDVATGVKPKDFNVFDGATDALIGGIFGGAVFGAGLKGLENVANSKDKSTIKSNVDKTFELQKALENPDISETTKVQLEKGIEKLVKTNQDLVKKNVEHADNLHPKVKEKLVEVVTKSDEIKEAVKAITLDNGTNDAQKKILLDGLKEDFKKHIQLKGEILDGKTTPVDVLPLKEQDKIKRQALKELTAEQNPDGKKSIEIDNAQIVERANKIYKENEQNSPAEAQPQAEVPQQAEAEKVAEVSPVEDVVAPSVENDNILNQNEGKENGDITPDGNVSLDPTNVGESGIAIEESPAKKGVPNPVDGGEGKGDASVAEIIPKNGAEELKGLDENKVNEIEKKSKNNTSKVPEGKGSWRKAFNEEKDAFKKSAILRRVAEKTTSESDLLDIKEASQGMPEESNILHEVERKLKSVKGDVGVGKTIEPHNEVNTDVETVKKELKLNDVESLIYDSFKGVSKDETVDKVDDVVEKWKDDKFGEIEAIESKINNIDIKLEDNGVAIDKIDEDETLSASKKKKAIAVLEKEFKDLQKQQKELEEQKEAVNESLKQIDDVLFHPTEDYNIDLINEVVGKVNNRLETRKSINEGTNLFPEDANIPEFVAIKKQLIQLTDEKTIADFNSRTAEQVKESEPIIADIKSKAKNAERISKEELEKGIADAEKLLENKKAEDASLKDVESTTDALEGLKDTTELNTIYKKWYADLTVNKYFEKYKDGYFWGSKYLNEDTREINKNLLQEKTDAINKNIDSYTVLEEKGKYFIEYGVSKGFDTSKPHRKVGKKVEISKEEAIDVLRKSVENQVSYLGSADSLSEAYHKAKKDGTDPEFVKSIEGLLGKPTETPQTKSNESANEGVKKRPTTKERVAERIKLSDAKIDNIKDAINGIDSIFGIKIKVDDIEGLNKNGIDIVEVIANIAKQAIAAGIHIDEAINKTIEHLKKTIDFDVNIDEIKERISPKVEEKKAEPEKLEPDQSAKDLEDFRDSWNKDPNPSGEISQYDSGNTIEREHGELRNNQDYEVQKDYARVQIGIRAIEHAKRLFGAQYVEKTLSFIEQANLSPEKKAVAYVLLENEMDARAKEFPKNVGVQKLQDLVRAKSQEFLANSARAMGAGRFRIERFRELAKNGFSEDEFTNAILTTKQINDKAKIQKLIQVSPDDINNESENQESDEDFVIEEPTVKRNKEAVKKDISAVLAQMRKDLLKVAKGNVAMSSIPYAAQLQAVAPHIIKLSKLLAELGGMTTRQIVNEVYNDIKEVFPGINKTDVSDILKEHSIKKAKPKTEAQEKQDSIKEIVKKALIEKGFSREITVTKNERDASGKLVKDTDGRNVKTKEKRTVLDWKKLAGEAGTIANIRKNVEESLKGSKYSKAEINEMKKALEREYSRLTADIIEKGLNELQNRNADRKPVNTKSAAKKLAELYNYGLFEKNKDSYEKIINSVLGFNGLDQNAFNEMKEIAKGYATLMDSGLSDTEIKSAVNSLSRRQSRLVATLAFSQADWKFKLAVALSEITNLSTRFKLVNLGNLAENVSSGMMARAANNMMDAIANGISGKKTSNKAIREQSKITARAKLRGITLETAESYGDTSSLLLNHSAVEDYFNNATTNKAYHAIISTYMAKPVLEGADSYNKILITEAKMVRAAIKVLEAKGMSNTDALDYVAKAITGESMKEALIKAKELIEKVNKDAGRKLLNDSESSIKSLAADIVKESLVSGGQLTEKELKAIYSAAYKSAGKDIGHVSNNWVTDQISAKGAQIEKEVADAIKEKKWGVASGVVVEQIFWKNFVSTFVGGGTNWFVKGLQKSANPLSLVSLGKDIMQLKMAGKLDVTTDEGIKNMEESLYRGMNLRSTSATMLMGFIITTSIISALSASGADDEIAEWLKENKWAKKYFDKMVPDAVVLMLAIKDKDFGRYIAKMVNVKADFFDDQKNIGKILEKYAKGYIEDDAVKISDASGDLGVMIGKRFEFPGPIRAAKDIKQIYKGVIKGEYDKANYYTSGFMNGFFQGGIIDMWGLRKDPDFIENDPQQTFLKDQEKKKSLYKLPENEKVKIRVDRKLTRVESDVKMLQNLQTAQKKGLPYFISMDAALTKQQVKDMDLSGTDESVAEIKQMVEEVKVQYGIEDEEE